MTLQEAVNAICQWLALTGCAFVLKFARCNDRLFEIAVEQVAPVRRMRTFQIMPEAIADCWKVTEAG